MPVTVTIGGDPRLTFADHRATARRARRSTFSRVLCAEIGRTGEMPNERLEVPAYVDFVLEGYVQPSGNRPKGPFGDHTGFYTGSRGLPGLSSHRRYSSARRFIRRRSSVFRRWRISILAHHVHFSAVLEISRYGAAGRRCFSQDLVFVSIRKQYSYQAFKVMHGLWGMGQMMLGNAFIVVVDEDCDVQNTSEVLFRMCANTDVKRDSNSSRIRAIRLIMPRASSVRSAHGPRRHP